MSAEAIAWAWGQRLKQNQKLVLVFLADSADRYGRGPWEVMEDISAACGLEKQAVQRHLGALEELELLKWTEYEGYRLTVDPPPVQAIRIGHSP